MRLEWALTYRRPDQLVLPYDPSFLPDVNLPGLDFDLSKFDLQPERPTSQGSSLLWSKSPETSQFSLPMTGQPQLDIPSSDHFNLGGFGSETDISSVQRRPQLGRALGLELGIEEGVLLQPDFEFDEDGNLIEFEHRPTEGEQIIGQRETPLPDEVRFNEAIVLDLDLQVRVRNEVNLFTNVSSQYLSMKRWMPSPWTMKMESKVKARLNQSLLAQK